METKENKVEVVLQPISVGTIRVQIKGKTPLLMDKFQMRLRKEY